MYIRLTLLDHFSCQMGSVATLETTFQAQNVSPISSFCSSFNACTVKNSSMWLTILQNLLSSSLFWQLGLKAFQLPVQPGQLQEPLFLSYTSSSPCIGSLGFFKVSYGTFGSLMVFLVPRGFLVFHWVLGCAVLYSEFLKMKFLTWIAQFLNVFNDLISKMPKFSIFDNFFLCLQLS